MKRNSYLPAVLLLAAALTACGGISTPEDNQPMGFLQDSAPVDTVSAPENSTAEGASAAIPEGAIADESGGFVYTGKLDQVGDDENGYIRIPLGFIRFQDEDIEGMLQYSDATGKNLITLDYYKDMDYSTAANSLRAYLEQQDNVEGLTGAVVSPNGYDAYQVYCHYKDGYFLVSWAIKDPAHPESCYYMSMEFDNEHSYIVACSSTFQTVEDFHAAETQNHTD